MITAFIVNSYSQTPFSNNFTNPAEWYIKNYVTSSATWVVGTINEQLLGTFNSTSGGNHALFDSYLGGSGEQDAAVIFNHKIKVNGNMKPHIKFQQFFEQWGDEITYFVLYSHNGDSIHGFQVNKNFIQNQKTTNPETIDIDLSNYILPNDSVFIGFEYYSATGDNYGWYIDDVSLYNNVPANDAEVTGISTLGKLPIGYATPHKIKAQISNRGSSKFTNLVVKLQITGVNTFTNSKTISSLAAGDSTIVTFDGYSPKILGATNVRVSIPADADNTNNLKDFKQVVTYNTYSYADTAATNNEIGRSGGQPGIMLVKYHINNTKTVQKINVCIGSDTWAVGKTVYAVLLKEKAKIIARSKDYVIKQTDLKHYVSLPFDTFPLLSNTDFYVGIAQPEAGHEYYPVGVQDEESAPFDSVYFYSTDLVATDLQLSTLNHRRMIEAVLGDPTPEICLVSADMTTGKNRIIWNKYNSGSIKQYKIYRESNIAGKYDSLGVVDYKKFSVFVDQTAIPEKQQYFYKLSYVDTMKNESYQSPWHETLFLQYNETTGQLYWQEYKVENKSLQFISYIIYKGNDSTKLQAIDTISASIKAYTDKSVDAKKYRTYYRIAGLLANGCNPSGTLKANGDIYSQSFSNMEDNKLKTVNIYNNFLDYHLNIYPNPVSTMSLISYQLQSAKEVSVSIFDVFGRKVSTLVNSKQDAGYYQYRFGNALNLSSGIYFLRFTAGNDIISKQLMITK